MPDVAKLVGDLTRLHVELDSSKAQVAKLKAKAAAGLCSKEKVKWAAVQVAESQALYDAIRDQLPPEVVAEAAKHTAKLIKAQAALDAANAELAAAFPAAPDVTVAEAVGAAHDATVRIEEN